MVGFTEDVKSIFEAAKSHCLDHSCIPCLTRFAPATLNKLRKQEKLTSGHFSPQLALQRLTFLIKENKADASLGTP